jgi:hypothetical protein
VVGFIHYLKPVTCAIPQVKGHMLPSSRKKIEWATAVWDDYIDDEVIRKALSKVNLALFLSAWSNGPLDVMLIRRHEV